jgi:hypothetical protein
VTEAEARAALRAFVAVGGIEQWIAEQRWEAVPGGWRVRGQFTTGASGWSPSPARGPRGYIRARRIAGGLDRAGGVRPGAHQGLGFGLPPVRKSYVRIWVMAV